MDEPVDRSRRWQLLLDLLADRGRLSVADAADALSVSAATVRRDFAALAAQQLATRTHGGVVATAVAYDLPARYRSPVAADAKARVARAAAAMVEPGMVVGFNGGTTTTATARELAARKELADLGGGSGAGADGTDGSGPGGDGADSGADSDGAGGADSGAAGGGGVGDASGDRQITIVTNALNIASEMVLRPHLRTICLGGMARRESYELYGPFASRLLDDLRFDLLLLGVDALSAADGAMCRHYGEAGINAEMVARARRVVVVATAEKLTRTATTRICPIQDIDALVTDAPADADAVADLRAADVDVRLV
jgi:DeoR family transcriptional regulator, aga operon transcriptional repressor